VQKDQSSVAGTQENGIIANSAGLLNTRLHELDDILNTFLQALCFLNFELILLFGMWN